MVGRAQPPSTRGYERSCVEVTSPNLLVPGNVVGDLVPVHVRWPSGWPWGGVSVRVASLDCVR
jgi:hypothetical protein